MSVRSRGRVGLIKQRAQRRTTARTGWTCIVYITASNARAPPASCVRRNSRGGGHGSRSVRGRVVNGAEVEPRGSSGNDSVMTVEHGKGVRWEEDRGGRNSRRVQPRVLYNSVVAVIVVAAAISNGGEG